VPRSSWDDCFYAPTWLAPSQCPPLIPHALAGRGAPEAYIDAPMKLAPPRCPPLIPHDHAGRGAPEAYIEACA
jgi:hypothetical protein